MTIYEKNQVALKEHQPELYQYIYEEKENKGKYDYEIAELPCQNGQPHIRLCVQGEWWQLNSQYDPEKTADMYVDGHREEIVDYGIDYIFGLGDTRIVRRLIQMGNDTNVWILHEPNQKYFDYLMRNIDLADLITTPNVYMSAESQYLLTRAIEGVVDYNNRHLIHHFILPNYDSIYAQACQDTIDAIIFQMKISMIRRNTIIGFQKEFAQHSLAAMKDILQQSNVVQMREYFKSKEIQDVPVIIVAAGPSLNKNIDVLKKAEGKALIIVVDAALRAVYAHHVKANLGISLDARVPDRFFEGIDIENLPFVFEPISRKEIVDRHHGRRFYDSMPNIRFQKIAEEVTGLQYGYLQTGGSVSTVAFSLALELGLRNIIFVGQDLAFTGGETYNRSLDYSKEEDKTYQNTRLCVRVKAQDGSMLETDYQMDMYRQWLEKSIKMLPDGIQVIDATEGGAYIEGTVIMTLEDAIETYCRQKVDFDQLLQEVPDGFTEEQRREIIEKFREEPGNLDRLKEKIREGEKKVHQLMECYDSNQMQQQKELIESLTVINDEIRENPMQDLLLYYNSNVEYTVGEDVFSEDIGISELCQKALTWYHGCVDAIGQLTRDLQRLFLDEVV